VLLRNSQRRETCHAELRDSLIAHLEAYGGAWFVWNQKLFAFSKELLDAAGPMWREICGDMADETYDPDWLRKRYWADGSHCAPLKLDLDALD